MSMDAIKKLRDMTSLGIGDCKNALSEAKGDFDKALEVLKKRVMGLKEGYRQNVALLGNRYIGKTALLHRLMSQMEEEDVFFIYLDLENRDFDYFAGQFTTL